MAKLLLQFWFPCGLVVFFFFVVPIQTEGINMVKPDVGINPDILCFCKNVSSFSKER